MSRSKAQATLTIILIAAAIVLAGLALTRFYFSITGVEIKGKLHVDMKAYDKGSELLSLFSSRTPEMEYMEILGDLFAENNAQYLGDNINSVNETLEKMKKEYYFAVYSGEIDVGGGRSDYDPLIRELGIDSDVDPNLIKAVIKSESNFNATAYRYEPHINDASYGLMQILCKTARGIGFKGNCEDLYDPKTNIKWGTEYLKRQLDEFDSEELALAAYNAGPDNVRTAISRCKAKGGMCTTWEEIKPYTSQAAKVREITIQYVSNAMGYYNSIALPSQILLAWGEPKGGGFKAEIPIPGAQAGNIKAKVVFA